MSVGQYLHSIDLGTTKTNSTIVEIDEDGKLQVVGFASVPSVGLRDSMVINMEKTTASIREAVKKSEKMAGIEVEDAIVGIAGTHIQSFDNCGMVTISRERGGVGASNVITPNDIDRVLDDAREIAMPADMRILHLIDKEYIIDGLSGITEPLGLTGRRLEVKVHVITGALSAIQNLENCVLNAGVEVRDLVVESIASGFGVLTEDEKSQGVVLVDLGGGTGDMAIYLDGSLHATAEIKYAGASITNDIATMFKIPHDLAEKIKCESGGVKIPDEKSSLIPVKREDDDEFYIHPGDLNKIIQARMTEILEMVNRKIRNFDNYHRLTKVVLTGGCSKLRNVKNLARQIFDLSVRIGSPKGLLGMESKISDPSCATGVGLILYEMKNQPGLNIGIEPKTYFSRVKKNLSNILHWLTH